MPVCPLAIVFGLTFLTEFSLDVMPLAKRFAAAFIPSLFGWSAVILMQKYSDNFTVDHPVQPVDLNQGKKGGRKGLSKNQKPSESGIRCCKRIGVTIGAIIVGYFAAHWILIPMWVCGHVYERDFPLDSYEYAESIITNSPSLYQLIDITKDKDVKAWAKHHLSPAHNPILWGYGHGGEAGIAMTVAILLASHGIYTMAFGLQVPKSGQSIRHTAYEEEVEPTEGDEDDEDAKEAAKAAAEEKEKADKKLSAKSAYGNVRKK